jgi:hypothetical protein
MTSSDSADHLRLDRDLPTTADDVSALRNARRSQAVELEQYLRFLSSFPTPAASVLRSRRGPPGPAFTLSR